MPLPITATVALLLAVSAAIDVRVRRIPNLLSAPAIVAGVALNALYCRSAGMEASLAALAVATAILLPPFALGGVGGGDVKVMGAAIALRASGPLAP